MQLLGEWVQGGSEEAFRGLVDRHLAMVYATARRSVSSPHQAQEVAQTVFIVLAKKASALPRQTVLAGWLYRATRYATAQMLRTECRRQRREERLSAMNANAPEPVWSEIAPHLEQAMDHLSKTDRDAVVLRFLEEKSLAEVGQALGLSEDAARKRVQRALEKLRAGFAKCGVITTSAFLLIVLSQNAAPAAPAGLAEAVAAIALGKGALLAASTSTLVKGTLKVMTWLKLKTVGVATLALMLCGVTAVVVSQNGTGKKPPERAGGGDNPEPNWAAAIDTATSAPEREQIQKLWCLDNLKQIGWAARQRSFSHDGVFPPDFASLKDDLYSPKCLACPSDTTKTAVTNWSQLKATNISYVLVSPALKDTRENVAIARCPIHGHVVVNSAQAFQGDYLRQTGMSIREDKTLR